MMTRQIKKAPVLMLLSILSLLPETLLADREASHAGDYLAMEFHQIGMNVYLELNQLGRRERRRLPISLSDFRTTLKHSSVEPTCLPLEDEYGVRDAINEPAMESRRIRSGKRYSGYGEIFFNIPSWHAMEGQPEEKIRLVLHEYFSVAGLESANSYFKSSKVIANLNSKNVDLESLVPTPRIDEERCANASLEGVWKCDRGTSLANEQELSITKNHSGRLQGELLFRTTRLTNGRINYSLQMEPLKSEEDNFQVTVRSARIGNTGRLPRKSGFSLTYLSPNKILLTYPTIGWMVDRSKSRNTVSDFHYTGSTQETECIKR